MAHRPAVLVVIAVLAAMAWRFLRDEELIEPGGSFGEQIGRKRRG